MKQKSDYDQLLKQSDIYKDRELNESMIQPVIQDVRGFKPVAADEYELLNIPKPLKKYINVTENDQERKSNWPLKRFVNPSFYAHPNLFSPEECETIINLPKSGDSTTPLNYSSTGDGSSEHITTAKIRISPVSWIRSDKEENTWIFEKIVQCIEETNNKYFNYDLKEIQSLQFTVYDSEEKGFYDKHIDTEPTLIDGVIRKLSISIQLSEPENYEGGKVLLHVGGDPIEVPKNRGTAIFFPSYTLHEVTPVTKGIRYSLVAWITGPKFK
jgi:PKHD-type hydroxylase